MKNGKFAKRGIATKAMVMILSLMLVVGLSVGGTLAWLTAGADEVKNTFTVGDISILLKEDKLNDNGSLDTNSPVDANEYKFVPGDTLNKRPYVTVVAKSEACYLFVTVTETNNTIAGLNGKVIAWNVDEDGGWTKLQDGVWYRTVDAENAAAGATYDILLNDKVTVNTGVTKTMVATINADATKPTLTFDAYAIQSANLSDANNDGKVDAADAWSLVNAA